MYALTMASRYDKVEKTRDEVTIDRNGQILTVCRKDH